MLIEEMLKKNEGKTLEFKAGLISLSNIIKTIIAFANTAGGIIVIGIEDKTKNIVGIENPLAEEERLASTINDSIMPLLMPDIEIQTYRNKELIIINVPHVTGPYYLKSAGLEKGTYIRLGSTNRVVDDETLQSLKNFARNIYFDELPYIQGKSSDLDWEAMETLFARTHKKITHQNASNIGLLTQHGTKEIPTFGGMILFGINRLKLFPDAMIRCARFAGNQKGTVIDQADIEIYLPFAIDEAIKFIQRNTRLGSEIKGLTRIDIPEYPPIAIREAIMNAIVHTDYAMKGVYISIAIFDERIEINNPGGLPFGLTIEKVLTGSSRIRNRVIAKLFHHLKWIEQWGNGFRRIIDACKQAGITQPIFEELNNQFRVTLFSTKESSPINKPDQEKLVIHLKKKKKISTKQAAQFWKVTTRTARSRLSKLVDAGIIFKTGTSLKDPQGNYVLRDK